jgi:Heme/copper-type cytochrome/quinol oxidase, subunit 3
MALLQSRAFRDSSHKQSVERLRNALLPPRLSRGLRRGACAALAFQVGGHSKPTSRTLFWLYFTLTGLHALHVTIGVGISAAMGFSCDPQAHYFRQLHTS